MRRTILAAAGLALLIPVALAQSAPAPAGAPAGPAGGPAMAAPPPPPPGGPRGPGMAPPPPPPPPSRAAHIHLQRGDTVADVKCADDDSTKACAEVASAMLDKLAGLPAPAHD